MALELLAPARNADQGILALTCGADAVYMGAARFGARQAAGCDRADFERLTREARLWGAKVYATLNTLVYDAELEDARRMAWDLYEAGVDALIIQDMAYLELDLPPLPLHASTQAVCDSPAKVAFLAGQGLTRAILARELSLAEIRAIHAASDIELEGFVYGALCVGESGQCYLSGSICGRSGNRGECAQPCRAPWNLVDASGRVLLRDKHLLSIKDLDLSDHLEELAEAGLSSFKIEGRLKDADYVKNVVSHLRRRLDAVLERRPEWARASLGRCTHAFAPDPSKTFQRGHSTYRLEGGRQSMGTPETGRHLGESIGTVRSIQADRVVLDRRAEVHPGDGLAFMDGAAAAGTVVNAVEDRQIFVQDPSRIRPGTQLHRNLDLHWLRALRGAKVERRIPVTGRLVFPEGAVTLRLEDETGLSAEARAEGEFGPARDPGAATKAMRDALDRMGDTPFALAALEAEPRFVPVSRLNALRREATAALAELRRAPRPRQAPRPASPGAPLPAAALDFTWNVANKAARAFYERAGARVLEPAAELQADLRGRVVMTTRHCLRFELGWCAAHPNAEPWRRLAEPAGPLFLENGPTRLECRFDCARCRMELVLREQAP
ncbi:peptidase U32 family protein [Mesoterricola silvestris]|uniref:Protease n=1 Tax=Mesoterricola silvestris TaxID=2927979 RepID=A0AA48K8D4_9BACT|nr:U32 family peptidase [Mesoterricola silvestris]BDU72156.1 protease [Mesoterricola silvestris]